MSFGPSYAVEALIDNIKRRCSVPTSQLTYEPEDFALIANDVMQDEVVPLIMSTREEYFVDYLDIPTDSTGIVNVPEKAVGEKLRSVCWLQQTNPLILTNLPRIDLDVVAGVGLSNAYYNAMSGFYVQGNKLYLYPNTSVPQNTNIRLYYYKRTLTLTEPDSYGKILSIDEMTSSVVLDNVPTDWETGTELNAVYSQSPFNVTNEDLVVVSVSSPSLILNTVEGLSVGDYISALGFGAIPQIPIEAQGYLAQLSAVKCLEGLGDREGMKAAQEKADLLKTNLLIMVSQRVDGSVKKVVNPNGGVRLWAGLGRWGRNRY